VPPIGTNAATVVALVAATALQAAGTDGYRLEPATRLRQFNTYDSIAESQRDLVVFDASGTWWAQYVTFVLPVPYEERVQIVNAIKGLISVDSVTEGYAGAKPRAPRSFVPSDEDAETIKQERERREQRLTSSGIRLGEYQQTEILSAPLHGSIGENVYSRVSFRVVDTRQIFSRACSLLIVSRIDHTREWARIAHLPIVLPFRNDADTRLVTKREMEIVESAVARLNRSFAGPVLTGPPLEPLRTSSTLLEVKERIDSACTR